MEHYLHVFFESIWSASIIPFASEPSFLAMKAFGGFNMPLAAALAITGATLGQLFNWLIGKLLLNLQRKGHMKISSYWYTKVATLFNKYGVFLLLFSWAPLCKMFLVLAGFLDTRFKFVLPLVVIGQAVYYGMYLIPA